MQFLTGAFLRLAGAEPKLLSSVLAGLIGAGFVLGTFYPGYMPYDAASQYWQARTGNLSTQHPPLMALTWMLTDLLIPGPGGLFLLQVGLYWSGLVFLSLSLTDKTVWRVAFILVVGLWPYHLLQLSHLLKDVGVLIGFLLAIGCLLRYERTRRLWWLVGALSCTLYASLLRHNAFPATLPLFWAGAGSITEQMQIALHHRQRQVKVGIFTLLCVLPLSVGFLINSLPNVTRVALGPVLQLWDLAAISTRVDTMLLPHFTVGPDLTVRELRQVVKPWNGAILFVESRVYAGFNNDPGFGDPYTKEQQQDIFLAWLRALWTYPQAYMAHRWEVTQALYGIRTYPDQVQWQVHPGFEPGIMRFKDNPPFQANQGYLNTRIVPILVPLVHSWFCDGWVYVLGAFVIGGITLRCRQRIEGKLALLCASSGLLYTLALPVIAPAADMRFHSWLVMATLLGTVFAIIGTMSQQKSESQQRV